MMAKLPRILGVSMSEHDRSAALIEGPDLVCAISEERLDRRKRSRVQLNSGVPRAADPPMAAIAYVLRAAEASLVDVDLVVCGRSITSCTNDLLRKLPIEPERVYEPKIPSHHLAHAASAFYTSPFADCDVLVIDEQGHHFDDRFERISWFKGNASGISLEHQFCEGDVLSLGMYYDLFAALSGLAEAGLPAAGKLMALASWEKKPEWNTCLTLTPEGDAFAPLNRVTALLDELSLRRPDAPDCTTIDGVLDTYSQNPWTSRISQQLAAYAQAEIEVAVRHVIRTHSATSANKKLAYAGGVALNCVANGRLLDTGYSDVFIHPAATDDGCAVGLAYLGLQDRFPGCGRRSTQRFTPFLGRSYSASEADAAVEEYSLQHHVDKVARERAADDLAEDRIVGWFQRGSEWGPRALGHRSILANPQTADAVAILNSRVKFREPFRPFGVMVAEQNVNSLVDTASVPRSLMPFMLASAPAGPELAAVAHVDGSLRFQTVASEHVVYPVLARFSELTGVPALINTSFNTLSEPLVETPEDAICCAVLGGLDVLYIDHLRVELSSLDDSERESLFERAVIRRQIEPLSTAQHLMHSGYRDEARKWLARVDPSHTATPRTRSAYAFLMMNVAQSRDERLFWASSCLESSGFPSSANSALEVIADDDAELSVFGATGWINFCLSIASQGGILRTVRELSARAPESAAGS